MTVDYITGDALEVCRTLPDASIDFACSSPPFLALRNYNDLDGQWGSEPTPADFLDNLLTLTTELGRVLTPTGSIAIELGDTFSGSGGAGGDYNADGLRDGQTRFKQRNDGGQYGNHPRGGTKHNQPESRPVKGSQGWPLAKSLVGIPTLYTWSLAYGRNLLAPEQTFEPWRIRNVIVWARNNPPVGALGDKYRPAVSYITVATRSSKRWFDLDAVRTGLASDWDRMSQGGSKSEAQFGPGVDNDTKNGSRNSTNNPSGAPPTDYWTDEYDATDLAWLVNGQPSKLAHYAMWPPKLAERLVLSMCPAEVCRTCSEPRRRITKQSDECQAILGKDMQKYKTGFNDRGTGNNGNSRAAQMGKMTSAQNETLGWSECGHGNYRSGHVLDPFAGSATTMCVAELRGRDSTGIDLDPANRELMPRRMAEVKQSLLGFKDENVEGQLSLIDGSL